jgi:uncharacterized membrane protein
MPEATPPLPARKEPDAVAAFPWVRSGIPASAPFRWVSLGLSDLHYSPAPSLFYGVCISALGALLAYSVRHAVAMTAAASTGFILLGPFLGLGLCELSRRRELHMPCVLAPTLAIWRSNAGAIGIFSMILLVLYLLWARTSLVVFAVLYSGAIPETGGFLRQVTSFENLSFFLTYCLVGGFFAVLAFAVSIVSLPLMLDRRIDAVTAALASIQVIARNPAACSVWALLLAAMVFIGIGTAWIGLVITMPIMGHASWHAYRDLVEPTD